MSNDSKKAKFIWDTRTSLQTNGSVPKVFGIKGLLVHLFSFTFLESRLLQVGSLLGWEMCWMVYIWTKGPILVLQTAPPHGVLVKSLHSFYLQCLFFLS